MKNLILTLIITLPLTLLGQGWEQTYGGHSLGRSVQQTTDGGYIITGQIGFNISLLLLKTDNNGIEQWSQTFSGEGRSVQQTTDGGYIITGKRDSDVYLIKTDENGVEQWSQTFGGDGSGRGYSVQQTTDGGYIITGKTVSTIGISNVLLLKTDENGNELWTKNYEGEGFSESHSVQQTTDGGFITTGETIYLDTINTGQEGDVYLIKTDENGNEEWSQTFGGEESETGYSVQQTTDGGYIITGVTYNNVYLIKTNESGIEQWSQTFGGEEPSGGYSVQQTTDGGYIITGYRDSDVYLIKTDENGVEQWSKVFCVNCNNEDDTDKGYSVQQTTDGGFIICGYRYSFNGGGPYGNGESFVYLIKTDGNGNITSTTEIPLPNPNRKLEKTINLIGQEIKSETNKPIIEIFDDGSVEKKIVVE